MNKVMLTLIACLMTGCFNSANVLSSDGNKELAFCHQKNWIKCISETCPNGYTIISPGGGDDRGIIKCNPKP